MTIKELKEKIEHLDDDMLVGGSGHYGEYLLCLYAEVRSVKIDDCAKDILCITIEPAGDEPD